MKLSPTSTSSLFCDKFKTSLGVTLCALFAVEWLICSYFPTLLPMPIKLLHPISYFRTHNKKNINLLYQICMGIILCFNKQSKYSSFFMCLIKYQLWTSDVNQYLKDEVKIVFLSIIKLVLF